MFTLANLFLVCAVLGGTIMVCQMILTLIGLAGDSLHLEIPHDAGHGLGGDLHVEGGGDFHGDAGTGFHGADTHGGADGHEVSSQDHPTEGTHQGSTAFFKILSFRTLVAALAFFGIAGLAADAAEVSPLMSFVIAAAVGAGAMYAVFWLMQMLYQLKSEGTVRVQRAVGREAVVYLRIPAERSGMGKVQIELQNRTMEYDAVTPGPELPTGSRAVVTEVASPGTLVVQAISEPQRAERNSHV